MFDEILQCSWGPYFCHQPHTAACIYSKAPSGLAQPPSLILYQRELEGGSCKALSLLVCSSTHVDPTITPPWASISQLHVAHVVQSTTHASRGCATYYQIQNSHSFSFFIRAVLCALNRLRRKDDELIQSLDISNSSIGITIDHQAPHSP